eukprot:TRINITY_DN12861_c0_g1_i1.p1 TRINITY_DN12861_c0_g1~~TRINITY_DN12861_c0_g1_i1.p1  ORF type:complete len:158 (+),score=25.40 TRINITY_DN12861_c0_g1_i1:47-520(+)
MNPVYVTSCDLCKGSLSKYRCNKCSMVLCSLDCMKQHDCKVEKPTQKLEDLNESSNNEDELSDDGRRRNLVQQGDCIVPQHRLQLLKQSEKIKGILKSERLRKVIKKIDNSGQRLRKLHKTLKKDPDFMGFVYTMLSEMQYIDEEGTVNIDENAVYY